MDSVDAATVDDAATKLAGFIESLSPSEQVAVVQLMGHVIRRTREFPSALETEGILSAWVRSGRVAAVGG